MTAERTDDGFTPLHDDVRRLGAILGQVVEESDGTDLYEDVERLRRACRDARREPRSADAANDDPAELVASLPLDKAERVARAFATLFHLVNLAEERHRVRVLRKRDVIGEIPAPDSMAGAVHQLGADVVANAMRDAYMHRGAKPVAEGFSYSSDKNPEQLDARGLQTLLQQAYA